MEKLNITPFEEDLVAKIITERYGDESIIDILMQYHDALISKDDFDYDRQMAIEDGIEPNAFDMEKFEELLNRIKPFIDYEMANFFINNNLDLFYTEDQISEINESNKKKSKKSRKKFNNPVSYK